VEEEVDVQNCSAFPLVNWWVLHECKVTRNDDIDTGQIVAYHFLESPFHLISEDVEGSFRVIGLAVVPDQLDMIEYFLDCAILSGLELVLHFEQIHRMLDDQRVIVEFEFYISQTVPSQSTGCMNSEASGNSMR
jgi:hypothetical protein